MDKVARVGIDLAKRVFHLTAVDADGAVLERRKLRRAGLQSYLAQLAAGCTVAMEACGGTHHWGRLAARHGHRVVTGATNCGLISYVKGNKNDVNDADAIAEASACSWGNSIRAATSPTPTSALARRRGSPR